MNLLFVCSGNICRSPMAHVMAETWAPGLGLRAQVQSAGTLGLIDRPAAKGMIAVGDEVGLDLRRHRSQALTAALIDWADVVAVMETAHALECRRLAPHAPVEKVVHLGTWAGQAEIADPIGSWTLRPYREARDVLKTAVTGLLTELAGKP